MTTVHACPDCGRRNYRISPTGEERLIAQPIGTWSLSGSQLKVTGRLVAVLRLECAECGWSIRGYTSEDGHYLYPLDSEAP